MTRMRDKACRNSVRPKARKLDSMTSIAGGEEGEMGQRTGLRHTMHSLCPNCP